MRELLAVKTFDFGIRTVEHRQQRIELTLLQCLRQVERVVAVFLRVIEIKRYFAALAGRQSRRQSRRRDRGQMLVDEVDELAEAVAFDLVGWQLAVKPRQHIDRMALDLWRALTGRGLARPHRRRPHQPVELAATILAGFFGGARELKLHHRQLVFRRGASLLAEQMN